MNGWSDKEIERTVDNAIRNGSISSLYDTLSPYLSDDERLRLKREIQSRSFDDSNFFNGSEHREYPDNKSYYDNLGYMLTGCERLSPVAERYYGIHRC